MADAWSELGIAVEGPAFTLLADGRTFTPDTMSRTGTACWQDGDIEVELHTSMAADGSHDVVLHARGVRHVHEVCLFDGQVSPAPSSVHSHSWFPMWHLQNSTALFLDDDAGGGVFACYANPVGAAEVGQGRVRLSYQPAMDVDGSFRSDPLVVGRYENAGRQARLDLLRGRDLVGDVVPGYADLLAPEMPIALDVGKVRAVRSAVALRVPWQPARNRTAHWDWGQNLYRLDAGRAETRAIYDRASQLCGELGVELMLVAPGRGDDNHSEGGAPLTAEGPWQHIMWLGMGQQVGHGRWEPGALPSGVEGIAEDARAHGVGLVPYVNPQFLWLRRDDWSVVPKTPGEFGDYRFTCLAVPAARQWLVETVLAFARGYDLQGFSFDFVFWVPCHATDHGHEPGEASRYAQWDGFRALLQALRTELPESWLEVLIGSQPLLPWGAADFTHPHPHFGDNQPQWLPGWPDLSLDRAAAHFQRRTAYWFRNFGFLPSYKVPGQVGHQANRIHLATPERGWDWDGARFNLLSAIATGPSSLSLCYLPCWDEDEWEGMRARDGAFFRQWIDFARQHEQLLAGLEDLFDEPRPGAVDGTVARRENGTGLVFLANPDPVAHEVEVPAGSGIVLRELHPEPGRLWEQRVTVEPRELAVLELVPFEDVDLPALFGAAGTLAEVRGCEYELVAARGTPGTTTAATAVLVGNDRQALQIAFGSDGVTPVLGGWRDERGRSVRLDELTGLVRIETTWVPGHGLPKLLSRLAPPTAPQGDELLNPWSDPSRLRLFPVLLDPQSATLRLWVDDQEAEIRQAYVGTWPDVRDEGETFRQVNNLLGHYTDLTDRLADADLERPWKITLELELSWVGQLRQVGIAHLPRRTSEHFSVVR